MLCFVFIGYYSYFTHDFPLMRPYTPLLKLWHNKFARYLNTYLSFSFVLFFLWERKWQKAVLVLAMTISVVALILTTSRGSYLAFFGIVCVWLYCLSGARGYDPRKIFAGLLAVVAMLSLLVWSSSPYLRQRISSLPQDLTTFNQRTQAWAPAVAAFRERPVFGWGYGDDIFKKVEPYAETAFRAAPPIGPHNSFVRILFHQGLIGIFTYIMLIAGAMYACYTSLKRSEGLKQKVLIAALSVLVGNYFIHSLLEVLVLNHLAVVLGLGIAAGAVRTNSDMS
jgi:O-antigen ligase